MCLAEVSALRYNIWGRGGLPINYLHLGLCVCAGALSLGVGGLGEG